MAENLHEILTEKRGRTFYKAIDGESKKNVERMWKASSISMWNIVNQLGKHFSGGSLVNSLKERKLFSDPMNRNRFDLIFVMCHWNCSTIENPRCLNSAAYETILYNSID